MAYEPCLTARRAVTTYDFQSPPYVGSLTRPSNSNLPREITMRDLAALTVTHQVGTREFTAVVWYALRSAYSGRQRQSSPTPKPKTKRSGSRIPVKPGGQTTPRLRTRDSKSSFTSPSSTSTIRPGHNSAISEPKTQLASRSPSPFSLRGPLETEPTSDNDDSRPSSPSSSVSALSSSLKDSHIDHRPDPSTQASTSNTAWIGKETLITRENMEAPLSKLRQETADHQFKDEVSELSLLDGTIYRPATSEQKTRLRSRASSTGRQES
ncbi:hypothetical protein MBLNU457_7121t1 [Dothideomycetes sp. NU457]